jgi:hypothetical protein
VAGSYDRIAYDQSMRTGIAVRPRAIVLPLKTGRHPGSPKSKTREAFQSIVIATLPWIRAYAASRQK